MSASPSVAPRSVVTTFAPDLELDRLQRARTDRPRERCRQRNRLLSGDLPRREAAQQRTREMREARIGTDQVNRALARGPDHVRLLLEYRQRDLHPRCRSDLTQQVLAEAAGPARIELVLRVADDLARKLGDRARETGARDLGGEQQRHSDRDPEDREALLHQHGPRAQPRAVQEEDVREAHPSRLKLPVATTRRARAHAQGDTRPDGRRAVRAPDRRRPRPAGRA